MTSRFSQLVFPSLPSTIEALPSAESPSLFSKLKQTLSADEELAFKLQQGQADALTVLFRRHGPLLFGIARRILRNESEAEDSTQQLFLDVFRSIARFDPARDTFKAWLTAPITVLQRSPRHGLQPPLPDRRHPVERAQSGSALRALRRKILPCSKINWYVAKNYVMITVHR